ncbi:hypothetical protein PTTW11_11551 [Pyrenophora teres f. teres]|uniref:Uncharacterized protein n=1 Tax=Pyrenophora teres f. teres TaxID=97479 RepID=A0A6S6WIW8_9PLEO|nr:hypothetical protein PTTW11_11551 [Pyrenophora teres f. teres]
MSPATSALTTTTDAGLFSPCFHSMQSTPYLPIRLTKSSINARLSSVSQFLRQLDVSLVSSEASRLTELTDVRLTLLLPYFLVYFMSTPSNLGLRRLVECDKRNSPLLSLSNAPTVGDTASEAQANEPLAVQADFPNDGDDDDDDNYNGLDFKRVPYLERR